MPNINDARRLLVGLTPPLFYPAILKVMNSRIVFVLLSQTKKSFYSPSWHAIPSGKLKGIKLYIDSSKGGWEKTMTTGTYDSYFTNYLEKMNLKNKVFFDIGAHIGYSSLVFTKLADQKGKTFAFEPNEFNRERLGMQIEANGTYKNAIGIFPQALSNKSGTQEFVFTNNVDGWTSSGSFLAGAHTRMKDDTYEREYGFKRTKVPTITLDAFVAKHKIAPDIMKIDVEGAEHLVLEGGKGVLKKYKPTLLMELHSIFATVETMRILSELAYKTHILHEDPDGRVFIAAESTSKKTK